MTTATSIIDELIRREGDKYTNRPSDRGGPTRYGITLKALSAWRQAQGLPQATIEDVQNLSADDARRIYQDDYIDSPGFGLIDDPMLQGLLIDSTVQHGRDAAIRWLQKAVDVKVDGKLGPVTAAAVNRAPLRHVYAEVLAQRVEFYGALVTDDPKRVAAALAGFRLQAENAHGWAARAAEFVRELAVL